MTIIIIIIIINIIIVVIIEPSLKSLCTPMYPTNPLWDKTRSF